MTEATTTETRQVIQALPETLSPYRAALSAGLFYLALGQEIPDLTAYTEVRRADCKSTRCPLQPGAVRYLDKLTDQLGSERKAVIAALAFIANQPKDLLPLYQSMTL